MRVEPSQMGLEPYKSGSRKIPSPLHQMKTEQDVGYDPRRGPSPEGNHASTLILYFPALQTEK